MASISQLPEALVLNGEIINVPKVDLMKENVFRYVFSDDTWKNVLDEDSRNQLRKYLPVGDAKDQDMMVHRLFSLTNFKFGNPLRQFHKRMRRNMYSPTNYYYRLLKRKALYKAYKERMLLHHTRTLESLILLRQRYLTDLQGLSEDEVINKLNRTWRQTAAQCLNTPSSSVVDENSKKLYKRVTYMVRDQCDDGFYSSSDEDNELVAQADVSQLLTGHRKRRLNREIAPSLDTRGITLTDVIDRTLNNRPDLEEEADVASRTAAPTINKKVKLKSHMVQPEKTTPTPTPPARLSNVSPFNNVLGVLKVIMTSNSLCKEMSEQEIAEKLNDWQESTTAKHYSWASSIQDWTPHISDILNVLADSDGLQLVIHTASGEWRWTGEGRDAKQHLHSEWQRILESCPSLALILGDIDSKELIDHHEDEPVESKHGDDFKTQEALRFAHPHKCFTYRLDGKEYLVGPVKGVYEKVAQNSNNKAREHALLVNDRPSYVTILTLVRDAAARLPNGEGTRYEICDLLKQSQFISPAASDNHINTVVSGALDRLHYEKDPCVKYDQARKVWVYLHGRRTSSELEMMHEAQGAALRAKKASKPSKAQLASGAISSQGSDDPLQAYSRLTPIEDTKAAEQILDNISDMETDAATNSLLGVTSGIPPVNYMSSPAISPIITSQVSHPVRGLKLETPESAKVGSMHMSSSALHSSLKAKQIDAASPPAVMGTTILQATNLPKGAVLYQTISTPQGRPAVMQKVLTSSPTSGKPSAASGTVMHRIVGNQIGAPVLARLIQTQGPGQKSDSSQSPQQFTHVQLQGGKQVAIPVAVSGASNRTVQILSAANSAVSTTSSSGPTQVKLQTITQTTMGDQKVVQSIRAVPVAGQAQASTIRLSALQQQLYQGKPGNAGTAVNSQSDPISGQVQLVKAIISSPDSRPGGSQAYLLTSNNPTSIQSSSVVNAKGTGQSTMLTRVLQPDGTLAAANSTPGSRSILTSSAITARKQTVVTVNATSQPGNQMAEQRMNTVGAAVSKPITVTHTLISSSLGEMPKKIEKSELSPSAELDIE